MPSTTSRPAPERGGSSTTTPRESRSRCDVGCLGLEPRDPAVDARGLGAGADPLGEVLAGVLGRPRVGLDGRDARRRAAELAERRGEEARRRRRGRGARRPGSIAGRPDGARAGSLATSWVSECAARRCTCQKPPASTRKSRPPTRLDHDLASRRRAAARAPRAAPARPRRRPAGPRAAAPGVSGRAMTRTRPSAGCTRSMRPGSARKSSAAPLRPRRSRAAGRRPG